MHAIREDCKTNNDNVKAVLHHYEACKARVEAKGSGACSEYYYEFFEALDKCVRDSIAGVSMLELVVVTVMSFVCAIFIIYVDGFLLTHVQVNPKLFKTLR